MNGERHEIAMAMTRRPVRFVQYVSTETFIINGQFEILH